MGGKRIKIEDGYFDVKGNVLHDLQKYALKIYKLIPLMNVRDMMKIRITLKNGETNVFGQTYLNRAKKQKLFKNKTETLIYLKQLLGFVSYDYFLKMNVEHDLGEFTKRLGKDKTIDNLNSDNICKLRISLFNFDDVSGRAYLKRAMRQKSVKSTKHVLKMLKMIVEINEIDYSKYNYCVVENIKHDLG